MASGSEVPLREFSGTTNACPSQLNSVLTVTGPSCPNADDRLGRLSFWYCSTGYRSTVRRLVVGAVRLVGRRPMPAHAYPFSGAYVSGARKKSVGGKRARDTDRSAELTAVYCRGGRLYTWARGQTDGEEGGGWEGGDTGARGHAWKMK
jgi:hypothetical protein